MTGVRTRITACRAFRLCLLAGLPLLATATTAQTLTLRLLNAKSGKPLPNKDLTFHWGDTQQTTVVHVDSEGLAHITVPPGITTFILVEGARARSQPDHLAFEDCNANSSTSIPVVGVATHGLVPRNTCGARTAAPHPGEIVFWGRVPKWWGSALE